MRKKQIQFFWIAYIGSSCCFLFTAFLPNQFLAWKPVTILAILTLGIWILLSFSLIFMMIRKIRWEREISKSDSTIKKFGNSFYGEYWLENLIKSFNKVSDKEITMHDILIWHRNNRIPSWATEILKQLCDLEVKKIKEKKEKANKKIALKKDNMV